MLKVGLTGGIGTGKSIVAKVFQMLEIPVYIADLEAKRLIVESNFIKSKLTEKFGDKVYCADSSLNRKYLSELIFNHPDNLAFVNAVVHPEVRMDFELWCKKQESPYVIQESAILFDTGLYRNFDKIICVTADQEIRIKRVMERDKVSAKAVLLRMKNQMDESEKLKKSDFIIYNNDDLILPQVLKIDRLLKSTIN